MTRIAIIGAAGRMGTRIAALASAEPDRFEIVGRVTRDNQQLGSPQVAIDFSSPQATREWLDDCRQKKIAMLIGTTGLIADDLSAIDRALREIAVLHATNTSLGVAVLNQIAKQAAQLLGGACRIEIVETHHTRKKDAPSGTALTLAKSIGRDVPIKSVREGDEVGTHTVRFEMPDERIELTHRALARDVFARGALLAAEWLARQSPGRYSIGDVMKMK